MMELIIPQQEILNTKDRIIDLINDGVDFLNDFELNQELIIDTISIVYKYLRITKKVPHNLYKFFIASYYIVSRHPLSFPAHESKKKFCNKFGLEQSSLEYTVEKLIGTLKIRKILDDKNFPYFLDPKNDLGFKIAKNLVKTKIQKALMNFYLFNQQFNSQIFTEELVSTLVVDMNLFPQELLRQYYDLIFELVEKVLKDQHYEEYVRLQNKFLI
ncbi:MAG: hypothetical protein ACFFAT_18120 [Promethearchaeota archaeon]